MESLVVGRTSPRLPSLLRDQTQQRVILSRKTRNRNKVWSPWASGKLLHASPPCCMTRLNQGYFLVKRKKQENSLESPGVGTTSPPLPSLLYDQTQPGLFSPEKEKAEKKVWTLWTSGQLPHTSFPCCVTRLNHGYSLGRRKKQGTKFGVPERRDNYPTPPLPAA